jgi:hypothetical protein
MIAMMMDDRFHLRVLLLGKTLLRQFPPVVFVRLARAFRVNRKEEGSWFAPPLATPAARSDACTRHTRTHR